MIHAMRMWAFTNTPNLIMTHKMRIWAFGDLNQTDPNSGLGQLMTKRAQLASRSRR